MTDTADNEYTCPSCGKTVHERTLLDGTNCPWCGGLVAIEIPQLPPTVKINTNTTTNTDQ